MRLECGIHDGKRLERLHRSWYKIWVSSLRVEQSCSCRTNVEECSRLSRREVRGYEAASCAHGLRGHERRSMREHI